MNKLLLSLFLAGALSCFGQTSSTSSPDQSSSGTSDQSTQSSHAKHHAKAAGGTSGTEATKGGADATFVKNAAQGGMAEVELGKLATEKASSDDVKQFGQKMVDDHSKANDQLKQIASQKSMEVPSDLSAKDKATKDRLSKLSGPAFDRAYMKHMVTDHTKDVAEFKKQANTGSDSDIKGFASSTLPTLEDHLKMAKDINAKVVTQSKTGKKAASTQKPS
jgi:putative membrane protein